MSERRVDVRAISFFRTEVHYKKKYYVGYIVNISGTGCAFAHENLAAIEQGSEVRVKFRMNGKVVNVAADVRWRETTITGLRFKKISDASKKQIRDYIRTVTLRRIPL